MNEILVSWASTLTGKLREMADMLAFSDDEQSENFETRFVMEMKTVMIGCWSGFWGDSTLSLQQLLTVPEVDYLVGDFLAEMTMSILVMQKEKTKGKLGYAADFVHVCDPFYVY